MSLTRAAVIIAVRNAGDLPELQAALDGAKAMQKWAKAHDFDSVVTITDEKTPVTASKIKKAVDKIVDAGAYDQLLIYFAGHGVNLSYSEYWLLSKAPKDTQEAVNVAGSMVLAKRCGIPHVVLISDACRTAPEGIRAQAVRGSEIFPNQPQSGPLKAVDVFYASLLGEPALEIQDKKTAAKRYVSVYTDELLAALRGERRTILLADAADAKKLYLRPRPLKRHLTAEVPKLVVARLGAGATETQTPDAEVLSDEDAFLEAFDAAQLKPSPPPLPLALGKRARERPPKPTIGDFAAGALKQALKAPKNAGGRAVDNALSKTMVAGAERITAAVERERQAFGPDHFETRCGFKIRGAKLANVYAVKGVYAERLDDELARVDTGNSPGTSVVLEFKNGRAVVLPAIRDFLAALSFENEELRNVSYEPADTSGRWSEYVKQRDELMGLRALIASSVHAGMFRLDREDAPKLTERIRFLKGLDPTMALYAAYSYHRMGRIELIQEMEQYLFEDLSLTLFDLSLLSERKPSFQPILPFAPLLGQGWSLLGAFDAWTPALERLRAFIRPSLWTLYEPRALPLLVAALKKG